MNMGLLIIIILGIIGFLLLAGMVVGLVFLILWLTKKK